MIALDPNKTFWYLLDESNPTGPALQCRFGTCRQFEEYEDALNVARTIPKNRDAVDAFLSALGKFVVGSRDLGDIWQTGIKDKLSWTELWSFCYRFTHAAGMSEIDLKKSESALPTDKAASAATAEPSAK